MLNYLKRKAKLGLLFLLLIPFAIKPAYEFFSSDDDVDSIREIDVDKVESYEFSKKDIELKEKVLKTGDEVKPEKRPFRIRLYRIRKGDSLYKIARKFGVSISTIKGSNNLRSNRIYPGRVLRIPTVDGIIYKIKRGDSLFKIAKRYKISFRKLLEYNKGLEPDKIYPGKEIFLPDAKPINIYAERFIFPMRGKITSFFGWRRDPFNRSRYEFHEGIDIAGYKKTVVASKSGVVIYAGWLGGYGKTVIIKHKRGYKTLYAHNSVIMVRRGQFVKQGQPIAISGTTGRSTGYHLHFEIIRGKKNINPIYAIKKGL